MPTRLTLVIHSLHGGGAERTLAAMANHWARQGIQITFVTLDAADNDIYELAASIDRVCLNGMQPSSNLLHAVINNLRRLYRLRRTIVAAKGDTVISFTDKMNILTLLACWGLPARVVISERVDPRRHDLGHKWSLLRRRTYPWCEALVVQTEGVRSYFRQFVPDSKMRVIANAAPAPATIRSNHSAREPWIIAMGRLEKQKGFDLLVEAFARVAGRHGQWRLKILGDGSQRVQLAEQIQSLRLESFVELCGWVESPEAWLHKSALFVLSSRYEGFPNALLEAMAAGLPVISFACESGPSEIIRHEIDGLLVPPEDVAALAQAIERLINRPQQRAAFGQRALEVTDRFSRDRFFQSWEAVLNLEPANNSQQREP